MGALQPEWALLADLQPQPISFQPANKPQYKPARYNNFPPQTDEWHPEQESQESDNEGEMLSLTGFSPADSNNGIQLNGYEVQKPSSRPLVGEVKSISDLESHHPDRGSESLAYFNTLRHRFALYRPILACESSGWHALAFAYFEIFLHSRSQIEVDEEVARISSLNNLLKTAGQFEIALIQHMINETISLLKDLPKFKSRPPKIASDLLLRRFNNPQVSGSIICHFRLIASSWLVAKSTTYEAHIPEGLEINTYRNRWLNAPHQEIDGLGMRLLVDALLRPLHIGFEVISVGEDKMPIQRTHPKISISQDDTELPTKTVTVFLLYRPSHYDILYTDIDANGEGETNEASNFILEVTPQATGPEFDVFLSQGCYQIPQARFLVGLPTFTPQVTPLEDNIVPCLENMRLSESEADPTLAVNQLGCILDVHTAVSHETFKAEIAPLTGLGTGLGNITAFAKAQEEEEAVLRAQRSRIKETEPKSFSTPLSSTKISRSLTSDSFLPQGCGTEVKLSKTKHAENIILDKEPLETTTANSTVVAKLLIEESLDADRQFGSDYGSDWEEEEEEEDEEEEASDEKYLGSFLQHGPILTRTYLRKEASIKSILGKMKNELEECLMKEFWDLANQILTSNTRMHGSPPGASSPSSENNESLRKQSSSSTPGKRFREDDNGEHPERDRERGSKRPKSVLVPFETSGEPPHFACPYRKHDPRRYNVSQWATCALTPKKGVSRVKAHLYRHHIIHQCPRCKNLFPTQEELDAHTVALEGCGVNESIPEQVEGITERMKTQLQSRKKPYAGQTEVERWQQVYQMLFPNEIVPSPYFEPVRDLGDDESQVPDSVKLEEYLRREVPQVFRILLDSEVDNELQYMEGRLKSRLQILLQKAHDCALTNYHSLSEAAVELASSSLFVDPQTNVLAPNSTAIPKNTSEDILESTTAKFDTEGQLDCPASAMDPKSHQHHRSCDSGCYADCWGTELSQQTSVETTTDGSLVDESVRPEEVNGSLQMQKAGPSDAQHDATWLFNSDLMTMDDPLNCHVFAGWN